MIRIRTIGALAAVWLLLPLTVPARAADAIEIPAILPITGPAAFLGKSFTDTLTMIEAQTNKSGGIGGRPIHFSFQDDQSNPQTTVQFVTAALGKNPPLLIDGGPLALCLAAAPLMKSGPVLLCLSPSLRPDVGSYAYGVMSSSLDVLRAAMNFYKARGYTKIGVINGTDATGQDADGILADLIKEPQYKGMTYAAYEHFNLPDLSVGAQIARIKSSGAQAVIAYTTGAPIATVLHGLADAGLDDLPVFTSSGNMSVVQLDGYKSFLPKELLFAAFTAFGGSPDPDAAVRAKIDDFRSKMKANGYPTDLLHAIPWDGTLSLLDVWKKLGPTATAQQLRDGINNVTNWPGLLGRYDFRAIPNRGLGLKATIIIKWDPTRSDWSSARS